MSDRRLIKRRAYLGDNDMPETALVTGASSGIGRELARIHAQKGGNLVIVARRRDRLETLKLELARDYGVEVFVMSLDLGAPEAPQTLYDRMKTSGIEVDVLINNAGFGGYGKFHERPWERDEAMIRLNVQALCALTHVFLRDMVARDRGRILNVASTAGLVPGPLQAVYYASKAFVLSFSQAIAEELSDTHVSVTALCPGPVATEFGEVANLRGASAFSKPASAVEVAQVGYRAMQQGKLIAIDDWKISMLLNWMVPFLPRRTVLRLSRRHGEKKAQAPSEHL
jgi:short-subunit dehydrogenase